MEVMTGLCQISGPVGVILYMMLVGYLPFDDRNMVVLYQKVLCSFSQNRTNVRSYCIFYRFPGDRLDLWH
jgi:hypothetical protein